MKVLITGCEGQLGKALMRSAPASVEVIALNRAEMDVAKADEVRHSIDHIKPAVVINAAAYTAVDRAESDRDNAFAINGQAPGAIADRCRRIDARLVHISTDFVFNGAQGSPYRPDDPPDPLNVYGASKLEGERQIAATPGLDWSILRTAWLYAPSPARNFMATMLRLFRERREVRVVSDQVGSPTSAGSLARCAWRAAMDSEGVHGMMHYSDAGVASWYDFATAIHEEALLLGLIENAVAIVPISSDEYPSPAKRPAYSVLDKRSTLARLQLTPVHWRVSLREVLREMIE